MLSNAARVPYDPSQNHKITELLLDVDGHQWMAAGIVGAPLQQ